MSPAIDFTGRTLLLTGANGGIPRAVATLFHALGANLVLTDLDGAALEAFAGGLPQRAGQRVVTATVDVTDAEAVDAAFALARGEFGGIDMLVPGAGLYRDRLVEEMTEAEWRETIAVNLDGVFRACRAAIPVLRDGGAVVTIASRAGHGGSSRYAHYAAAKGAVLAFSRSLARELAPRGIRVNCVSPGPIDTAMFAPTKQSPDYEGTLRPSPSAASAGRRRWRARSPSCAATGPASSPARRCT